jgi:hypothetical protein
MAEGPKLFECEKLKARISPKQCLINQIRAATLKEYHHGLDFLWSCIKCSVGRRVRAYFPGEK